MDDFNPYAAPQSEVGLNDVPIEGGVWRDGALLVMMKGAALPDRCLKCNRPANGWRLKRNLSWHEPGYYALIILHLFIYLIVALIVRRTAKIGVPLCEEHRRQRTQAIVVGWSAVLLGFGIIIGAVGLADPYQGPASIGAIFLMLFGLVYGVFRSRVEHVKKIDKQFVLLKKVHPAFLVALPAVASYDDKPGIDALDSFA